MESRLHATDGRKLGARWMAIVVAATVLLAGGCATTPTATTTDAGPPPHLDPSRPLQVSVDSPITHPWIWTDQVAESFYNWMVKGFRAGGYQGSMLYVFPSRETPKGTQRLDLRINSWKLNRDNSVEADIHAVYDSGDGVKRNLGVFRGVSMKAFAMQDRISLDNAYDESAQNAARELLKGIAPVSR